MSDTPRADAIAHRDYQLDALATRTIGLARQLERENAELRARLELWRDGAITRERDHENTALRSAAVEVAAIGRVWITVWGDQLSGDSVRRFGELEQQILREANP